MLQRLPGRVLEHHRGEQVRTLAETRDLAVEVHCRPAMIVIQDSERALLKIPANGAG